MTPNRPRLPSFDENNPTRQDAPELTPSTRTAMAGIPFPVSGPSPLRPRLASLTDESERKILLRRFPRAISISGVELLPRVGLEAVDVELGDKSTRPKDMAIDLSNRHYTSKSGVSLLTTSFPSSALDDAHLGPPPPHSEPSILSDLSLNPTATTDQCPHSTPKGDIKPEAIITFQGTQYPPSADMACHPQGAEFEDDTEGGFKALKMGNMTLLGRIAELERELARIQGTSGNDLADQLHPSPHHIPPSCPCPVRHASSSPPNPMINLDGEKAIALCSNCRVWRALAGMMLAVILGLLLRGRLVGDYGDCGYVYCLFAVGWCLVC